MKREPKQEQFGGADGVAGVYLEVMSRLDTDGMLPPRWG
jgi:hypothetical protein